MMKSQDELTETKVQISIADVKGNDELNGQDIADLQEVITQAPEEEEEVFTMVEQMPQFPGGNTELLKYISKNVRYPAIAQENGIEGRVIVRFVVEKDGTIGEVQVVKGVDASLDKEAVRVVKTLPQWVPGKQNGRSVRVWFTLPVTFRLE